jgi:hypothetical protein
MRVAVCLSGQPRTWRKCLPNWETLFAAHGEVQFDVFYHLWDFNTPSASARINGGPPLPNTLVPESEMRELHRLLEPVAGIVESEDVNPLKMVDRRARQRFGKEYPVEKITARYTCSQFYSQYRVAHLKRQHELRQNFTYDACVRVRADTKLTNLERLPLPEENTIYASEHFYEPIPFTGMQDTFYYANSRTFDRFSDYFIFMDLISNEFFPANVGPEYSLFSFTQIIGISTHFLSHTCDVVRPEGESFLKRMAQKKGRVK